MSKSIKVLNVVDGLGWCGTKEQTFLISKYLSNYYETYLAIHKNYDLMISKVKRANAKVKVMFFQENSDRFFKSVLRLRKIVYENKIDVVISHSSKALNYTLLACSFFKNRPVIIALKRSDFVPNLISQKFKYGIADRIVVTSSYLKEKFSKLWGEKLLAINSGIELNRFTPSNLYRKEYRKKLGISDSDIVFINVANFQPWRKGQNLILQAFKRVASNNWKLILVGHDTDSYQAKKLMKKFGLENMVIGVGFTQEVEKYLQAADFFVFASFNETLAAAVLQAMATGKVVISTLAGGIGEYLKDGINGFAVPVGDVEGLADRMLRAVSLSPSQYAEISKRAVETAEKYSIEETGRKWKELIESLCS